MKVKHLIIPLIASFFIGCEDNVFKEGKDRFITQPGQNAQGPYPSEPPKTSFSGASSVEDVKDTSFVVNWPQSADSRAFLIYNAENGSKPKLVRAIEPPATSATIEGLRPGTDYRVSVRLLDERGLYDLNDSEIEVTTSGSRSYKNAISLSFKGDASAELGPGNEMLAEGLFTMSLWFKKSGNSKSEENILVFHKGRQPGSAVTMGVKRNEVFLSFRGGGKPERLVHQKPAGDGKWHHIAATYNGTYLAFYLDGHMLKKKVIDLALFGTYPAFLGSYSPNKRNFKGQIDEVSIWSTAMSSNKIREIYNEGTTANLMDHPMARRLVSWYRMGDDERDSSGKLKDVQNNFDAVLFGTKQDDFTLDTP